MKRKVIVLILTFISPSLFLFSQEKSLILTIDGFKTDQKNGVVTYTIANNADSIISIIEPKLKLICDQLMYLYFVEIDTKKEWPIFPCTSVADLRCVIADSWNCIQIKPKSKHTAAILIPNKMLPPLIKGKCYTLKMGLLFKAQDYETEMTNLFIDDLESNFSFKK